MSLKAVRDQDASMRLLGNMLLRRRIPNGLLFWGPGGVGKRLAAVETAKAIHCRERENDACDACLSCRKVAAGNHPDVVFLAPVSKSRIITVEMVRSMTELATLRPFESDWRVFIIQDAERMGVPAQNHFLKTLEEPPGNSLFILVSESPGLLLPTIRSRCQRIRFGALRPETVAELLERTRDLPPDTARAIAAVAQGQMSRALDLVDTDKREVVVAVARQLSEGADPLALAEDFADRLNQRREEIKTALKAEMDSEAYKEATREDREEMKKQQLALAESLIRRDIMEYLFLFQTWYRDALVLNVTGDAHRVLNRDQIDGLRVMKTEELDKKCAAMEKAKLYIERNLKEERVLRDLFLALSE
ncbi:MAG TPA: DNA polymerase III subunit delta' [Candidatus Hydrogenedentes bacterium]|nr:DNA polymerase III subunit delta' [Candidatus Hydrogenedentota bacterium]